MKARSRCVSQLNLLHLLFHLLNVRLDPSHRQLDLSDLLVNFRLVSLALVVLEPEVLQRVDESLVLLSTIIDVLLSLLQVLGARLLELPNLLLHVLEMLV